MQYYYIENNIIKIIKYIKVLKIYYINVPIYE